MAAYKNRATSEYRNKEDQAVHSELLAAGIPVLTLPSYTNGEVKTHHIGILNGFVFTRAWRYWACEGDVPLGAAKEIHRQFGDLGIRAEGHAANPEPTGYCPDLDQEAKQIVERMQKQGASTGEILAALERLEVAPGTPKYVSMYHIDTEEGLKALANFLRENHIFAHNGTPGSYAASVFK